MSRLHGSEHDARLAEALARRDASGIEALLASCGECREQWESLKALGRDLDRAGREFELDRTTPTEPGPPGEVLAAIRLARGDARAAKRRPMTLVWWVTALAAALVLIFWFRGRAGAGDEQELVMGVGLEALAPRGLVESFAQFEGKGDRPSGGFFRISVFAPGSSEALVVSPSLDAPRWQPTAEELARLPTRIEWRLESFVAGGESRVSPRAEAERR